MTTTRSLDDWLATIENLHPQHIEMGLARAAQVYARMDTPLTCPIITVGGTNGKGSTCAFLEAMLTAEGYRVGLYTSPHLHRFNERARIVGDMASDAALTRQFEAVEAARGDIQLTYFEFTTLAIMRLFAEAKLDVAILEVGLGGRLDAVNIVDADVAIVTNVDIDHMDYLGNTRELIGFEKAGIFRPRQPALCGDFDPPASLVAHALSLRADLQVIGRDFRGEVNGKGWHWSGRKKEYCHLPLPRMQGRNQIANASMALAALEALQARLPVSEAAIHTGLQQAVVAGRFQVLPGKPVVILDVAHNPHAAAVLARNLTHMPGHAQTHAVFGAMRDKDIDGLIDCMKGVVDHWYLTDLPLPRAASAADIAEKLSSVDWGEPVTVQTFPSPQDALKEARRAAGENDRIAVFGSFWTVAGVTESDK
jgi:dihydrofolate synthase/folylpolyglutamate synthase